MNRSFSKKRHILESNLRLENRFISEKINTNFLIKEEDKKDPELSKSEKSKKVLPDTQDFYKTLENIDKPIYQEDSGNYNFQKEVESVQIALSILGYPLPNHGIDGLFGPETAKAVNDFKKDNDLKIDLKESLIRESQFISPVPNWKVGGGFYQKRGNTIHGGVDLAAKSGTEIIAPDDGKVIMAQFKNDACGGTIIIQHKNDFKTAYCHCKEIGVSVGQEVKQGEVIGLTGGAKGDKGKGNSTGAHLHLTVKKGNERVDPELYFSASKKYNKIDSDYKPIGDDSGTQTDVTGKASITPEMVEKLIDKLKDKDLNAEDLSKYTQKSIDFSNVSIGNDKDFYSAILDGIGAPKTDENFKFLFAWRQAEGGKATNNPFNTTQGMKTDPGISNYNYVGVKNYSSEKIGVEATVRTLLNGRYGCIVDGLKNDVGASKISMCLPELKTWGTGEGIARVLRAGKINPPPIA